MVEKHVVFGAIDGERDYQVEKWKHTCAVEGIEYVPDFKKSTAEYLSFIAGYNADLLYRISHASGDDGVLDVFRKLAALCVACMEFNGACSRDRSGGNGMFLEPMLKRSKVYAVITGELEYQNELRDWQDYGIADYVIFFQHRLTQAFDMMANSLDDALALSVVRQLAGIAIHCMMKHGLVYREPFNGND